MKKKDLIKILLVCFVTTLISYIIRLEYFWVPLYNLFTTYPGDIWYVFTYYIEKDIPQPMEYPVGVGIIVRLAGFVCSNYYNCFLTSNFLILFPFALGTTFLIYKIIKKMKDLRKIWIFLILAPSFIFYSIYNYDLPAVFFTVLGIYLLLIKRYNLSVISLAVGTAIKIFPVLILPLVILRKERKRESLIIIFSMAWLAINLPFILLDKNWAFPYIWNAARLPNIDSFWWLIYNISGNWFTSISVLSFLVLYLLVLIYCRKNKDIDILRVAGLILMVFLLTNKIYSPQYHLWLLPFLIFMTISIPVFYIFDLLNVSVVLFYGLLTSNFILLGILVIVRYVMLLFMFLKNVNLAKMFKIISNYTSLGKLKSKEFCFLAIAILIAFIVRLINFDQPSWMVFDETHYVSAAEAILDGQQDPNWIQPPLGKFIIALSMKLFGNNPLGWRVAGMVFGVGSIVVFYLLVKKLLKSYTLALLSAFLFSFDFLHFLHSRIAMLDVFLLFFTIAGFYFLVTKNRYSKYLAGLFFGLAVAVKWVGLFGILASVLYLVFTKRLKVSSFLILTIIPLFVYLLSYSQYFLFGNGLDRWSQLQLSMLSWHTTTNATHPYSSKPLTWMSLERPVWYEYKSLPDGQIAGIVGIPNPVVWFVGILSLIFVFYRYYKKRLDCDLFILVWFLAFYLPWFLSARITFLFYVLPIIPVMCLAIARCLSSLPRRLCIIASIITIESAIILFLVFYPAISGYPVDVSYYQYLFNYIKP